jgi:transposase
MRHWCGKRTGCARGQPPPRSRHHAAGYTADEDLLAELQAPILQAIATQLARIDRELAALAAAQTPLGRQLRLLTGIPGVGRVTPGHRPPRSSRACHSSAYTAHARWPPTSACAPCPRTSWERTSGSSVRGRSHTGPLGPASVRRARYLPALTALRVNPPLRAFAERLRTAGKRPKVIVVAVMRTLLVLAWTLLRRGQPFSPTYAQDLLPAPTGLLLHTTTP